MHDGRFKIKNKIFIEAGGKREAGGDDKPTFFMGPKCNLIGKWNEK
jgi:hypothetical protein